jgi:hypothetical protein
MAGHTAVGPYGIATVFELIFVETAAVPEQAFPPRIPISEYVDLRLSYDTGEQH